MEWDIIHRRQLLFKGMGYLPIQNGIHVQHEVGRPLSCLPIDNKAHALFLDKNNNNNLPLKSSTTPACSAPSPTLPKTLMVPTDTHADNKRRIHQTNPSASPTTT